MFPFDDVIMIMSKDIGYFNALTLAAVAGPYVGDINS